ncbi:MAG: universal stress protein [Acidiferrobacterales bacterium]|nr:universal stress protein [Acidiferrobacterales bacterium]
MSEIIVIGLDGHESGGRALQHGAKLAKLIGDCELLVAYVIEWSPYSFQTAEENEKRHQRREEEISVAQERVIDPALAEMKKSGISASGVVRHGDVADTLNAIAGERNAQQIVVGKTSEGGFTKRLFGSSTTNLVMGADVPVTVVN